jgi:glycosyltransferase involved in cell wall biosynthesis
MNILMFNYEYPPVGGGGGVVHALIAEELARRHRVVVVTSRVGQLPRQETVNGVEVHRVPVLGRSDPAAASLLSMLTYPPGAWVAGARLVRRERFDVVNSHFAVPTGPGSLPIAKLAGLPHVVSLHGGDVYDPSKRLSPHRFAVLRLAVTQVLRRSSVVIAQSNNTRDNVYRYYRYRGPIEIVPLGIRIPEVPVAPRSALGLPAGVFLLVTVGRLVRRKGVDELLRILARPGFDAFHLAVIGTGPELPGLQALSQELGLAARIHFLGRVSEETKWQVLKASDAYVSTTMHEGFGLVYLEGMASGLPIVTYDNGGQTDFLADGVTGRLVPVGQIDAMAAALQSLAADPAAARRIGASNLARAEHHRIETCAAAYERILQGGTAQGRPLPAVAAAP